MIRKIFTICVLLMFLRVNGVFAAEISDVDPYVDGKFSPIKCAEKGGFDFLLFLNASTFSDGLGEGIIEPWKDVLARNQCHGNQVYSLIKQQDKMRAVIRDAFLTCQTQKLPKLKKAFNKLSAEIYYVRHIVAGGIVMSLPYDIVNHRLKEAVITDRTKLYNEMYDRYVGEETFDGEDFDNFFLDLESKYADSKYSYINCEKGSWEAVGKKWEEFSKFFSEDYGGLKQAGKNIAASADKLADEATNLKTIELIKGDLSFGDYLESFAQVSLNQLSPKEGFQEISDYLTKEFDGSSFTRSDFLKAKSVADKQYDLDAMKAKLKNEFTNLYAVSSDETLELFLNNLDGRTIKEEGLLEIIDGTFSPLNEVLKGSKTMLDRQCPGT